MDLVIRLAVGSLPSGGESSASCTSDYGHSGMQSSGFFVSFDPETLAHFHFSQPPFTRPTGFSSRPSALLWDWEIPGELYLW